MKIKINQLLLYTLFALLTFTACQDEITVVDNPTNQEVILANSTLSSLMSRTTANFGGADDILDGSSCFSVNLPVTIIVSDITIVIETEEDLDELQNLFYDFDDDLLDFIFPITIIFNDYTEVVIENEDQLNNYIIACSSDEDDVIDCVDFVYPISFSVFNSQFNLIDTVIIDNDEALYIFLDELEENENALIVSLNYPVTLQYANGNTIEANTNEELADIIAATEDDCQQDDDCEEEEVILNLVECPWEVYLYTNNDMQNLDGPYNFSFNENGTVNIAGVGQEPYSTSWDLSQTDTGLELNIGSFYYYEAQFGTWLVVECDDDDLEFIHQTVEGTGLYFGQDCDGDLDCSPTEISAILQECPWDFTDGSGNFTNYQMIFLQNGVLQITEGDTTVAIGGSWNLSATDNNLIINFSELTAFQDSLGGDWVITECDPNRIVVTNENKTFVLEKNCDGDLFNCFGNFEIIACITPTNIPIYNLSANTVGLINCSESFTPSFHESLSDAENNINAIVNTEAYGTLSPQVYLRIESNSGNFQIFNIYLSSEECNPFACFQSFDAQSTVCDNGTDGPYTFNLEYVFSNCIPSADAVTYHVTQADAEAGLNAIANPEFYTSINVSQIVYARVEISNQFEVFPIQLLIVNCNELCSEEDVDTFLTECLWHVVNFNGSDNLMNWNFSFNSSNQIVVIYTDTETIDANWATSQTNEGVIVTFSNVAGPNIQVITGEWLVVECEADRLELHRQDDIMVLERTCN